MGFFSVEIYVTGNRTCCSKLARNRRVTQRTQRSTVELMRKGSSRNRDIGTERCCRPLECVHSQFNSVTNLNMDYSCRCDRHHRSYDNARSTYIYSSTFVSIKQATSDTCSRTDLSVSDPDHECTGS